ncbi:Putative pyruvate, phosphate dikinase regulatory protein [Frankliniella fusca]|uniref:Pyruvate, phosphate dikinase regulatory protein n=1 Tax=Frankliniella fusca TaxID=407009 RepID=A0AAE1L6F6_9NEOP|nr:Putative pyruvate, phosphate dikinase regulatory protein [Frankliniella fusca]
MLAAPLAPPMLLLLLLHAHGPWTSAWAVRRVRGLNVRYVAAVGPPLQLTRAELGQGLGLQGVRRVDAAHVQVEADEDSEEEAVEQEGGDHADEIRPKGEKTPKFLYTL